MSATNPPADMGGTRAPGRNIGTTVPFLITLLAVGGAVADVQGVAISPLLGTLVRDLGLTPSETSWALTSMSVAAAVTIGFVSRAADVFGHKRVLVPLTVVGLIGAVIAALSTSFVMLVVGRALIGASITAPAMWALLKVRATSEDMQTAAVVNGTVISVFTPLGLILGGLLLNWGASWTAAFWVVSAGFVLQLALAVMTEETPPRLRSRLRFDVIGSLLLGAWLVSLLIGISKGNDWGWGSAKVLGFVGAGLVLLVVWIFQQRAAANPLLDFRGMDKRQTFAGYATYCSVAVIASGLYIIVPAFAQTPSELGYGFGASVLKASMILIMILPMTFVALPISRKMLATVGPRPPMIFGGVLVTAAFVWGAFAHSELWQLYVCTAVYGLGIVVCFNVGWALTAAAGRVDNMSITFGIQYALAVPAGAIGQAVIVAIMTGSSIPGLPVAVPTVGTFQANFLLLAGVGFVGLTLLGAFVVPKRLTHQGSAPGIGGPEPEPTLPLDEDLLR